MQPIIKKGVRVGIKYWLIDWLINWSIDWLMVVVIIVIVYWFHCYFYYSYCICCCHWHNLIYYYYCTVYTRCLIWLCLNQRFFLHEPIYCVLYFLRTSRTDLYLNTHSTLCMLCCSPQQHKPTSFCFPFFQMYTHPCILQIKALTARSATYEYELPPCG